MNQAFVMNGYFWHVYFVNPSSSLLIDRTCSRRVATTDANTLCIYLSEELRDGFLKTVLIHELGHAAMFSYGLLSVIHSFVRPSQWIEAEEWICNFIANYGDEIFNIANDILSPSLYLPRYSA